MTTFIDTGTCQRVSVEELGGEVAEIVNRQLCGAKDVVAMLRWLTAGQTFVAAAQANTHQLIYVMAGEGVIGLDGTDYPVTQGAGVYLEPDESATVAHAGAGETKLLHLLVPIVSGR